MQGITEMKEYSGFIVWNGSFVFVWGRWQSVLRSTTKGRGDRIDKLSTIHNMSRGLSCEGGNTRQLD